MAGFNKKKEVKQKNNPKRRFVAQGRNPEQYFSENPVWAFANADQDMWAFSKEHIGILIWTEILPRVNYSAIELPSFLFQPP